MAGKCEEHNLTPYVIQKLWVDEEKQENEEEQGNEKDVEKVEMELTGTNRLHQVWVGGAWCALVNILYNQGWDGGKRRV